MKILTRYILSEFIKSFIKLVLRFLYFASLLEILMPINTDNAISIPYHLKDKGPKLIISAPGDLRLIKISTISISII